MNFLNNNSKYINDKAKTIDQKVFTGGPLKYYERMGRQQLVTLMQCGLYPHSKVLDVGCGSMRGGYWLINFLNKNCYCGIEPNKEMLTVGKEVLLDRKIQADKKPRFDHNDKFDFSVFNEKFDFIIARSIWSHASKKQIRNMLDSFVENSTEKGVLLASYLRANPLFTDYKGSEWVGLSHQSEAKGLVHHSRKWLNSECKKRGLVVLDPGLEKFNRQRWVYIVRANRKPYKI